MKIVSMQDKLKGRKCFICKTKGCIGQSQLKVFCSIDCQAKLGLILMKKNKEEDDKSHKRETKRRRKEAMTRTEWYDKLQKLVNQYVLHVRDKDKPCCTCGKSKASVKYDAGHYRSRGACSELRFELNNIHKQCSVICNQVGSGMRAEYILFIKEEYGDQVLDWLDGPHVSLKTVFPHWSDIEKEILKYRKLLRDNGVKPSA